jgi:hypothetical protein
VHPGEFVHSAGAAKGFAGTMRMLTLENERIVIIALAWRHFNPICLESSELCFDRFSAAKDEDFQGINIFSMSSLSFCVPAHSQDQAKWEMNKSSWKQALKTLHWAFGRVLLICGRGGNPVIARHGLPVRRRFTTIER